MQINTTHNRPRIVAVLGPTNTGKTHFAMERMLGHATGIIGFPLRLLARENYDRAVAIKGRGQVALITGEEKIIPANARYFLCTVESMPLDRDVAFLGVDEIQMCADPDRGHVFTERLLFARGAQETMFMGADTIRPLLKRLVAGVEFMTRPRLSTLTYSGEKKTARLNPRTAIVAFSASEVYAIAEMVRRQRGGAAVVLGALSPRTRNAQVAMYQSGEVDYLIATDAIGMGLNMDVDHVAFAQTRKFDGRVQRRLTPPELAQTAGRAGRHMNDGTFGTTGNIGPLEPEIVEAIESHTFEPLKFIYWRNPALDFSSLDGLLKSLGRAPGTPGLLKAREADDEMALRQLAKNHLIADQAGTPWGLRLLWDVCRVPDFGQVMSDGHARLLSTIYRHLMGPDGRLPVDWLGSQISRLDRSDGDIETLSARIAGIRTWTYVSYQAGWTDDPSHWQEQTRAIEDKLSDVLHERLTQRFVDKRTTALLSRIKETDDLLAGVAKNGEVTVEGHHIGQLEGFCFCPDGQPGIEGAAEKSVLGAAMRALRGEIEARVGQLSSDADDQFELDAENSRIAWRGHAVARLVKGDKMLRPLAEPLPSDLLQAPARETVRHRLQGWLDGVVGEIFGTLLAVKDMQLSGPARGIVFQLSETLGSLDRQTVLAQIDNLSKADRRALRQWGVRIGRHQVFLPALLKPPAVMMRGLLWGLANGVTSQPSLPNKARVSFAVEPTSAPEFYAALGFVVCGRLAVRADIMERLAAKAWAISQQKTKPDLSASADLMSLAGCGPDDLAAILKRLGYKAGKKKKEKKKAPTKPANPDSPFAKLDSAQVR
ncbi:MAG: helicase-related protein [Proteobacteria bacterium]|nr:helicase-related protein [Pseudomonadota bacterium]MDA1024245.1 helicase-related protein [Pseudomonadota bacterium]